MSASLLGVVAVLLACPQEEFTPPEITKHHEYLKQFAGNWDAVTKFMMEPGQPMVESKGTEKARLTAGGLWLVFDYKGSIMGTKFVGHGIMGYNTKKKKYVGNWVDSMASQIHVMEGTCEADGKKFTMIYTSPDPRTGEPMKMKQVTEVLGEDRKKLTFLMPGPDGEEMVIGTIDYTRKVKGKKKEKKSKPPKKPE